MGIWIRDKFKLKMDRSVKTPWQEYGVVAGSQWLAPEWTWFEFLHQTDKIVRNSKPHIFHLFNKESNAKARGKLSLTLLTLSRSFSKRLSRAYFPPVERNFPLGIWKPAKRAAQLAFITPIVSATSWTKIWAFLWERRALLENCELQLDSDEKWRDGEDICLHTSYQPSLRSVP